jgi:hypothetical protein
MSDLRTGNQDPVKVLSLLDVSQVDVLEEYQLLIVLSGQSIYQQSISYSEPLISFALLERQVITFPLEALDPMDPLAGLKRAKRISSHTSFFKAGICLGKVLVCIVKSSPLSSTIKTLEPIDQNVRGRSKPTFRKLLQGGNDTLKLFRVSSTLLALSSFIEIAVMGRSSIFLSSRTLSISSRPNYAWGAQGDLR